MLEDHRRIKFVQVPLDTVLSLPMFLRFYLIGRFMALNSVQFRDAATRSIARLNRVTVNFGFVMKSLMSEHPLRVLFSFTVIFWIATSWILVQCERCAVFLVWSIILLYRLSNLIEYLDYCIDLNNSSWLSTDSKNPIFYPKNGTNSKIEELRQSIKVYLP